MFLMFLPLLLLLRLLLLHCHILSNF